eukprot:TRINITY_DN3965_c0_g1_i1.p1 TRINITY_DN3965_c0_g1~~TRINITY_DN3965_c0_g1_i1.p1  ORF type:complete len:848 (+),score=177.51 TRINITY_DN3965_c0_g1_i1:200-2545(+)
MDYSKLYEAEKDKKQCYQMLLETMQTLSSTNEDSDKSIFENLYDTMEILSNFHRRTSKVLLQSLIELSKLRNQMREIQSEMDSVISRKVSPSSSRRPSTSSVSQPISMDELPSSNSTVHNNRRFSRDMVNGENVRLLTQARPKSPYTREFQYVAPASILSTPPPDRTLMSPVTPQHIPLALINPASSGIGVLYKNDAVRKVTKTKNSKASVVVYQQELHVTSRHALTQKKKVEKISARNILHISRSKNSKHQVKIVTSQDGSRIKEVFLNFSSQETRERFYEASFASKLSHVPDILKSRSLRIFTGTWNVGEAVPPESLRSWLDGEDTYDLYAIAVQECEYPVEASRSCEEDWFDRIQKSLGSAYVRIAGTSLLSIRLCIFILRQHCFKISNIEIFTVATGIANVIGNKGGIAISFQMFETKFCFIGSHLAAHQKNLMARNKDYRHIIKGIPYSTTFSGGLFDIEHSFHYLFWFGDLNYRIDLTREEVLRQVLSPEPNWELLEAHDQLLQQRRKQKAFVNYQEGPLRFPPTYRYNRGDRTYNDPKLRVPSWCDRILWKTLPGCYLQSIYYESCDDITTSDHSPVRGLFAVEVEFPNHVHEEITTMMINISELRCRLKNKTKTTPTADDRDNYDSKLSVMVEFHANFLVRACVTVPSGHIEGEMIYHSWADESIPSIVPFTTNEAFLSRQHLFINIKNTRGMIVAQGVIALKGLFTGVAMAEVETSLYSGGRKAGSLSAKLSMQSSPRVTIPSSISPPIHSSDTSSCSSQSWNADDELSSSI